LLNGKGRCWWWWWWLKIWRDDNYIQNKVSFARG
jgi:hypothetical protein